MQESIAGDNHNGHVDYHKVDNTQIPRVVEEENITSDPLPELEHSLMRSESLAESEILESSLSQETINDNSAETLEFAETVYKEKLQDLRHDLSVFIKENNKISEVFDIQFPEFSLEVIITGSSKITAQNIADLFIVAIKVRQKEILCWYCNYKAYEDRIEDIKRINKIDDQSARTLVYNEIKALLPDITDVNLRQRTFRAKKIYTLLVGIGIEKIQAITCSARFISLSTSIVWVKSQQTESRQSHIYLFILLYNIISENENYNTNNNASTKLWLQKYREAYLVIPGLEKDISKLYPKRIAYIESITYLTSEEKMKAKTSLIKEFKNWSSGNYFIDESIKTAQLRFPLPTRIIEWIPYEDITDIQFKTDGGLSKIFSALWIKGRIDSINHKTFKRLGATNVILKKLKYSNKSNQKFLNECTYRFTRGFHVVPCLGITKDKDDDFILVMDTMIEDLRSYIGNYNLKITLHQVYDILYSICERLASIHSENLCHGDLHPGKVLRNFAIPM
ncbi:37958_t:CDS:2, partial [Gigaspora margarita]